MINARHHLNRSIDKRITVQIMRLEREQQQADRARHTRDRQPRGASSPFDRPRPS